MLMVLEVLDLWEYDFVISSEFGFVKGVIIGLDVLYVCYCYFFMWYLWDYYYNYCDFVGFFIRLLMWLLFYYFRIWDFVFFVCVDKYVVNLNFIRC